MFSDEEFQSILKQSLLQEYPEHDVNDWFKKYYNYNDYIVGSGNTWAVYKTFVLDKLDKKPRRIINV